MFISNSGSRGYTIANSLRFRRSASAYLSRTFSTPTDNRKYTISGWVKRGQLGVAQAFFPSKYTDASNYHLIYFDASDKIVFSGAFGGSSFSLTSPSVFRDPSAWYHITVVFDSNNGTANLRALVYVNNVAQQLTGTNPGSGQQSQINTNATTSYIGGDLTATDYFDGYLSDVYFIDGQALTPSSFGQTDTNGVWVPKAYSGTYGTNGFYLKFNDGSSTTNLCLDRSGNGNNWTPSGISVTAGATYDWMVDTPTNNYCTLNPIQSFASLTSSANLTIYYANTSTWATAASSIAVSSGKWYWETTHSNLIRTSSETLVGILANTSITASLIGNTHVGLQANGYGYYSADGQKWSNGAGAAYGSALTNGDVLGIALDADAGTITFYKNNVSLGVAYSGLTGPYMPAVSSRSGVVESNFGQRPFTYTPPTGFKALCTANLPAVTIANGKKHFDVAKFTGNAGAQTITQDGNGNALQTTGEFLWFKRRGAVQDHFLLDVVRGYGNYLSSNATAAEGATTIVTSSSQGQMVLNGFPADTYVSWLWKANGAGVTNTSGSITSTVSANTTAGFSIVTYTGNGTAGATIGHGLVVAPKLVIVKKRSATSAEQWITQHSAIGATKYLLLNGTAAAATDISAWNNTAPTSSVVTLGAGAGWGTNTSTDTYVAYCFAEVPGFSRFGSYTGNGSTDGPFVYCGFRPRWVMVKYTGGVGDWSIVDTARNTYNIADARLDANGASAETVLQMIDVTANGFKVRTTNTNWNTSSGTIIFAAFAENPFGGSNTAPATAR